MVNNKFQLTKQSSDSEIKAYFEGIAKLMQSNEPFPVNLEDVWQLVYVDKGKAVRALRKNELFIQGVDYQVFTQNGKNPGAFAQKVKNTNDDSSCNKGGRPESTYMLSVSCLEFFIARKVRPVFEVYRKVFHKVVDTVQSSTISTFRPISFVDSLEPLAELNRSIMARFKRLQEMSGGCSCVTQVLKAYREGYLIYRGCISDLTFLEGVAKCDGTEYLKELRYTDGDSSIQMPKI